MTVIVTTFARTVFPLTAIDGVVVTLTSSFYVDMANSSLVGITSIKAVDSVTGQTTYYSKTKTTNLPSLRGVFIDVMSTSPYWLAVVCSVDGAAKSEDCSLSRTPDVDHDGLLNIVDLASVALWFGRTCGSSGCEPLLIPNCSPQCRLTVDLNADGTINLLDLVTVARSFGGRVFPP